MSYRSALRKDEEEKRGTKSEGKSGAYRGENTRLGERREKIK